MSKAWAKGSTTRWRRVRALVLEENRRTNQGRCVLAIPRVCQGQADQVHHTRSRAEVGDDPKYLMAVCRACNLKVGAPGRISPEPKQVSSW